MRDLASRTIDRHEPTLPDYIQGELTINEERLKTKLKNELQTLQEKSNELLKINISNELYKTLSENIKKNKHKNNNLFHFGRLHISLRTKF